MTVAFVLSNSDHGAMIVNRFDFNKGFNDQEYGVGCQILTDGAYDPGEVDFVKQLLFVLKDTRGDGVVALDCGANIGVHTVEWARFMRDWGYVVAVEAQERLFYALAGNLALHNSFNARAIWAAISDAEGHIDIPEPDYTKRSSFGSFELKERLGVENIGQPIDYDKPNLRVRTMTIDGAGLHRCDFLKIDVEGMELEAIAGGLETIKACRPIMYIERIKVDEPTLKKTVEDLGYKTFGHGMMMLAVHKDDPALNAVQVSP